MRKTKPINTTRAAAGPFPGPLETQFSKTSFGCILADPPWQFEDRGSRVCPEHSGCARPYPTMPVEEIAALDVDAIATEDAFLWFWTPWTLLLEGAAHGVVTAWGFAAKQVVPWIKVNQGKSVARYRKAAPYRVLFDAGLNLRIGGGHYVRCVSEALLLCVRKPGGIPVERRQPGVIAAPRHGHSEKPVATYDLIEAMCDGPRIELFARGKAREGWSAWGNEAVNADAGAGDTVRTGGAAAP